MVLGAARRVSFFSHNGIRERPGHFGQASRSVGACFHVTLGLVGFPHAAAKSSDRVYTYQGRCVERSVVVSYAKMIERRIQLPWLTISWGVFLLLVALAFLAVNGFSLSIGLVLVLMLAVLVVWRFPFVSLNVAFCSLLLSGIIVPISTGTIQIGERAFGAMIEVTLGELITIVVMLGWALRVLLARDAAARTSARPWLPVLVEFGAIVLAQLVSVFSRALPDPILVVKYALRPVLFVYLAAVALPANFIRSWRRMDEACLALVALGVWFALDGVHSLFIFGGDVFGLYRAHPLMIFGLNPLGGNHHALAELMVLVAPLALALAERSHEAARKTMYRFLAGFFWTIALLTFARAAWLVTMVQVALFAFLVGREWVWQRRKILGSMVLTLIPVGVYMIWFSLLPAVANSTSARTLLLDIAWSIFRDNPLIGAGAGTFPDRLSHIWAFAVEFGAAEDAHGMWQKVAAETGLIGLLAVIWTFWSVGMLAYKQWTRVGQTLSERRWFACLIVSVVGAFSYQLFSTSLWSARVWISVGLLFVGMRLLQTNVVRRDPDFLQG